MASGSPQTLRRRPEDEDRGGESWGFALRGERARPLAERLPAPMGTVWEIPFASDDLVELRELVATWARREALAFDHTEDLVLAVHEIVANSVRHGGGEGLLRMWRDGETLICDVQDSGRMADPQIGRRRPGADPRSGRGMWIANQLCDLVEVSCSMQGSLVRLHKRLS